MVLFLVELLGLPAPHLQLEELRVHNVPVKFHSVFHPLLCEKGKGGITENEVTIQYSTVLSTIKPTTGISHATEYSV